MARVLPALPLVLLLASATAQRVRRAQASALALQCGTRIPWLKSLDAALLRAQEEHQRAEIEMRAKRGKA